MTDDANYTPPKGFKYDGGSTFIPLDWGPPPEPPPEVLKAIKDNRFLPAHDNVLVYHIIQEETEGGILIPDKYVEKNKNHQAWVIAVGPDANVNDWEAGQLVTVSQFAGVIMRKRDRTSTVGRSEKMDIMKSESLLGLSWKLEEKI